MSKLTNKQKEYHKLQSHMVEWTLKTEATQKKLVVDFVSPKLLSLNTLTKCMVLNVGF